ncbi:MAG: DUF58 domain-containing protein [Propionibacteriales bacterium]|nr:DUF58 domain-containing protein [Propionibacteriales bacterium]
MTVPRRFRADDVPLSQLAPEQALRRLELQIVRRLEGFLHGEHLGLLPGPGTDLAEARLYMPGEDDVRRMDWAVSARTTTPHVRDVIADRELETWVLVDLSPSMHFGTAAMEKRDLAVAAVATMGLLTFRVGDRFGGYVLRKGQLRRWPTRSGRLALFALLRSLLREPVDELRQSPSITLAEAIRSVARGQRKRGLRVVVSDFLDLSAPVDDPEAAPPWEKAMRELSARNQVIAVEIIDPRELDIPNVGSILLQDPETGDVRELNTGNRRVRRRYAEASRLQRERTARALRRAGVGHLVLRTDRDWVADTARFALKHRRVAARLHQPPRGVAR